MRTASPTPWRFIGRDEGSPDVPPFSIVDARGNVIGSVKYGWDGEAIVDAVNAMSSGLVLAPAERVAGQSEALGLRAEKSVKVKEGSGY